jgi:hypothetical protein
MGHLGQPLGLGLAVESQDEDVSPGGLAAIDETPR